MAVIPLNAKKLPASDLIYQKRMISPEEALGLELDLSTLEPKPNDVWDPNKLDNKKTISINDEDTVFYQKDIKTSNLSTEFIVKVLTSDNTIETLLFDKKLHSTFLRHHLLKKLGYQLPEMKYLKKITIAFKNLEIKEEFLKKMLRGVLGKPEHWIVKNENESLEITFHDVAAISINEEQLYDLAGGVPVSAPYDNLNSRVVRAVVLPYSLVDLKESVNKFTWNLGQIDQKRLIIPHFFAAHDFSPTTINDVRWIARKIAKLNKEDFKDIVSASHFPDEVSAIVLEKILSRRNSILELLDIPFKEIPFNSKLTILPNLKKGKITKIDWHDRGYASKFAAGDATSPFKDFHYYLFSILQSVAIDNFISKINDQLEVFDPSQARIKLAKKEFNEGLEHFVRTGQFLQFPVSAWTSPILNGSLIASRDVVIGNYLGTQNLVQLADTFGYGINTGLVTGLENLDKFDQTLLSGTVSYVKSFTHLKPLLNVKDAFKEDYRNIIVPLLKRNLRKYLDKKINNRPDMDTSEEDQFLSDIMKEISKVLGVGESLLITERLSPSIGGRTQIPLANTGFSFDLAFTAKQVGIKRMQILRKDASTIQIFDDLGNATGNSFSVDLNYKIPVIRYNRETLKGKYSIKSFTLNIEADKKKNRAIYQNLEDLNTVLTTGSTQTLEATQQPALVDSKFNDIYNRFSLLFWKHRRIKGYTRYNVSALGKLNGDFVSYRDFYNRGNNWESFTKDVVQYFLSKASGDIEWANGIWRNPGETLGGNSQTDEVHYEARVKKDGHVDLEFMRLGFQFQGWAKNVEKLKKIAFGINEQFEQKLFTERQFIDIKKLSLYEITAFVNIYQNGINRLKTITNDAIIKRAYFNEKAGLFPYNHYKTTYRKLKNGKIIPTKGHLAQALNLNTRCHRLERKEKSLKKKTKCWLDFANSLFKSLRFNDFLTFIGSPNVFVFGEINGFRKDSEILRDPILSNTFGQKDPNYPNGPIEVIQRKLNIAQGEFEAYWLRTRR